MRRRMLALSSIPVVIIVLLVIAQLVLPGLAATHIRNLLKGHAKIDSVSVSAFPAVELLWHHADHVKVKLDSYESNNDKLTSLLNQVHDVGTMDLTAETVKDGLVTIHDATFTKRGNTLTGTGTIKTADLKRAVPLVKSVKPIASGDGKLVLRGTVNLVLADYTTDAVVEPYDGGIAGVFNLPILGSQTIQVFSDPKLTVQSVGAKSAPGGFSVTATATLN